jgi:60 kDa SS-A/Ro ribonucleoprotein
MPYPNRGGPPLVPSVDAFPWASSDTPLAALAHRLRRARRDPVALLAGQAIAYTADSQHRHAPDVVHALDAALHAALRATPPTGRRVLLALDVSASMDCGEAGGVPGLTPRHAAAAMALMTAATEPRHEIVAFHAGGWFRDRGRHRHAGIPDGLTRLPIAPDARVGAVVSATSGLPFGATDCALPMLYALALEREVDTFVVYTDDDAWVGDVHPVQALRDYRSASGIDARLVVVQTTAREPSIAGPVDAGMLELAGFDTATPRRVAAFARR